MKRQFIETAFFNIIQKTTKVGKWYFRWLKNKRREAEAVELGLFTCGYQRYPLEQAFEDAGRFGYDYIELWGGYPHA